MIKKFFWQNEYIFKKDLHFICNTNILCTKKYFSNEIYIFYIFIYIFLCKKSFFSVEKFFNVKLFFHIKTFFSVNNVYFVKNTNIFWKNNFFFQLSFATNKQPYFWDCFSSIGAQIHVSTKNIFLSIQLKLKQLFQMSSLMHVPERCNKSSVSVFAFIFIYRSCSATNMPA